MACIVADREHLGGKPRVAGTRISIDVVRELEQESAIGKLHETVYSTTGVASTLAHSERMGREFAAKLRAARVDAVILTST